MSLLIFIKEERCFDGSVRWRHSLDIQMLIRSTGHLKRPQAPVPASPRSDIPHPGDPSLEAYNPFSKLLTG